MKLILTILLGFISLVLCAASVEYYYPPVFWQKDNCPFRQSKELFIKVLPYTGMNVVCPSDVSMNTWGTRSSPFFLTLYENLWQVNKKGYDKCEVNKDGKLLLVCDDPTRPKRLEFKFHPIYSIEEPRFIPGKHYYFITTSRGEKNELTSRRKSGYDGHCVQYHMKLHIYVCNPKEEDCIWEMPRCDPPSELQQRMLMIDGKLPGPTPVRPAIKPKTTTRKPPIQALEATTKKQPSILAQQIQKVQECKEKSETSINMVMNFVLGGVIAFLIAIIIILSCALTKRSKGCNINKPPEANKQTRIYESIPVQLPPVNMVPIGSPQADYLVYTRACTPDPQQHTLIRTPHHNYEAPVFRFPEVPQRSRAGSTQVKSSIERQDDNMDAASV